MSGSSPRPNRFGPSARLTHKREFEAIYAARARVERGPLIVHAIPNTAGHSRLGLSIGRRLGNAVRRNRLKRKLREVFRLHRAALAADYDVIIGAKPHEDAPIDTYRTCFLEAMSRLHDTWTKRQRRTQREGGQADPSPPPSQP